MNMKNICYNFKKFAFKFFSIQQLNKVISNSAKVVKFCEFQKKLNFNFFI